MSDDRTSEITTDELGWDEAVVQEGRKPGAVVSVRLNADESSQVRVIAEDLGVSVSEVMRRALATFSVENRGKSPAKDLRLLVTAFTYGGGAPTTYRATIHRAVDSPPLPLDQAVEEAPEDSLTGTEPIRVTERVLI